jgi:hypothetical protein
LMIQNYTKTTPKAFGTKNEQFDLLVVLLPRIKALQVTNPLHNTLENTPHSYKSFRVI